MINSSFDVGAHERQADPSKRIGRPVRSPREVVLTEMAREAFSKELRSLRESAGWTTGAAARQLDLPSSRAITRFESEHYPSGDMVGRLAKLYGISPRYLAAMVLKHSDPMLYEALTGEIGFRPSEAEIAHRISAKTRHQKTESTPT